MSPAERKIHTNPDCYSIVVPSSTIIGKCVHIGAGVNLGERVRLEDGVSIARTGSYPWSEHTFIRSDTLLCKGVTVGEGATIFAKAILPRTKIGNGAKIGPGVTISSDSKIGEYACVYSDLEEAVIIDRKALVGVRATILSGAKIGANSRIMSGATVGEFAVIGEGVTIYSDCIIGAGAVIEDGAVLDEATIVGGNPRFINHPHL